MPYKTPGEIQVQMLAEALPGSVVKRSVDCPKTLLVKLGQTDSIRVSMLLAHPRISMGDITLWVGITVKNILEVMIVRAATRDAEVVELENVLSQIKHAADCDCPLCQVKDGLECLS